MLQKFNPFEKADISDSAGDTGINLESIQRQQQQLLEHLQGGNTINFLQARDMGIGYLNSRISDLRKEITIHDRFIRIGNVKCKEYSLAPFEESNVNSDRFYKSIIGRPPTGL